MHDNKQDNETNIIDRDNVIGELIKANMMLLPFVIDPHGRWGPILQHFLSLLDKILDYNFPWHQPNAQNMFTISTTHPYPIGILRTADCIWYGARIRGTKTYIFNPSLRLVLYHFLHMVSLCYHETIHYTQQTATNTAIMVAEPLAPPVTRI